jgi:hypothetical protein
MRKQQALLDMSFEERQKRFLKKLHKEASKHNLFLGTVAAHDGYDWVGKLALIDADDTSLRTREEVWLDAPAAYVPKKGSQPKPPLADHRVERQRCQNKSYDSFDPVTLKGVGHQKRCLNKPTSLLVSTELDENGCRPFMSVCHDCLISTLHDSVVATGKATLEAIPKITRKRRTYRDK